MHGSNTELVELSHWLNYSLPRTLIIQTCRLPEPSQQMKNTHNVICRNIYVLTKCRSNATKQYLDDGQISPVWQQICINYKDPTISLLSSRHKLLDHNYVPEQRQKIHSRKQHNIKFTRKSDKGKITDIIFKNRSTKCWEKQSKNALFLGPLHIEEIWTWSSIIILQWRLLMRHIIYIILSQNFAGIH